MLRISFCKAKNKRISLIEHFFLYYIKKGVRSAKAPTQDRVWGREFLDSLTLAKILRNSAERLVRTQDRRCIKKMP
jgi:hypothetical protein